VPTWFRPALFPFALLAFLAGCSSAEPFPDLHPLTGTVTRGGKPVAAGGLIFLPDPPGGTGLVVNANVKPDGTFTAETSRNKPAGGVEVRPGAPTGRYKVVYHPPSNGEKMGLEVKLDAVTVEAKANNTAQLVLPTDVPRWREVQRDDGPDVPTPERP
jgi:hypothetical protein